MDISGRRMSTLKKEASKSSMASSNAQSLSGQNNKKRPVDNVTTEKDASFGQLVRRVSPGMSESKLAQPEPNPSTQVNQNVFSGSLLSQVSAAANQQAAPNQGDGPA